VPKKRDTALAEIIETLEKQMQVLESIGLAESASLLRIAWLDLKCRNERVSVAEFEAFCARIAGAARRKAARTVTPRPSRTRKRP
jgi:hypothetical protein